MEEVFHDSSYGYRPKRSAHQAIESVRKNVRKYPWVIDMDIKSFFDEVDHELLMRAVEKHVQETWIKMYVKRWLEMPIEDKEGRIHQKEGRGTPQGGVISPLLANLFLHYSLDQWLSTKHPQLAFVRYADDLIIHCHSEQEAEKLLKAIKMRMQQCKLRVHEGKTKIVTVRTTGELKSRDRRNLIFLVLVFSHAP